MGMLNLTAFNLRSLGDTLTVITIAKRGGVKDLDELEYLVTKATDSMRPKDRRPKAQIRAEQFHKKQKQDRMPKIKCSVCEQYMRLLPVNNSPSTQVGGAYQSCGLCMNPKCMNTDYFLETLQEKRIEGLANVSF